MGDPREPTEPLIRRRSSTACASGWATRPPSGCPSCARRSQAGRAAASARRSTRTRGDPDARAARRRSSASPRGRRTPTARATRSRFTDPGYPVYERGALFAPRGRSRCRCARSTASCPTSTRSTTRPGAGARSSGSTTRTTPPARPRRSPSTSGSPRWRESTASSLASDEAYTELWFDEPPASALQLADRTNVVVFNTLSKRSSMTGYRSGFAAGDPALIAALKAFRPTVGTAPQEFVQRASVVAWGDEEHVERRASATRRKRELLLDLFERKGLRVAGSEATMYSGSPSRTAGPRRGSPSACSSTASLVAPGSYLGRSRRGLRPDRARPDGGGVRRAVAILERGAVTPELAEEIVAALDRGERRVASQGRRRVGRRRRGEGGDPRVLPAAQGGAGRGRARSPTTTRSR